MLYDELGQYLQTNQHGQTIEAGEQQSQHLEFDYCHSGSDNDKDYDHKFHILYKDHDIHCDPCLDHAHCKNHKRNHFLKVYLSLIDVEAMDNISSMRERRSNGLFDCKANFLALQEAVQLRSESRITTSRQDNDHFTIAVIEIIEDSGIKREIKLDD